MRMTSQGKRGNALGEGGAKQQHQLLRDKIRGISKWSSGSWHGEVASCLSGLFYQVTRGVPKAFLKNIIRNLVIYTEDAKSHTVNMVYALKKQGQASRRRKENKD
ncbi:histone H4-like isoform X2 [Chiloscyllium plagiosum]|uniref:histone H4-like isoform X2 n=1 Tax=Chiloscyllium plagiosum TaxID=36176 RepID=UPI001CB7AFFA|nr:histone H4-like isoform X2 [Chiloscyllium plagiosum]